MTEEFVTEFNWDSVDVEGSPDYVARERVVRCRNCKHAVEICGTEKLDCMHFAQWDYYLDEPGQWLVEPNGFCAWGEPEEE